ncbi:2-carboxy-1,4-naphthoquinone phytyltransferase [Synechococcus sp. PCC 7336]|uniref:2-carboxy-1,4-naphthoquinone phytyltransferase n=1 Tax=Synechococcus sp. PCC 7336 TaxID=195250 RepID=UPI00068540B6|nr:2-carboxy-1,4-naphthoquinone phytyltransferase [Synechococcus sp. PCC 7336]
MAAIKPPMYSVAMMPIWLGTAIARTQVLAINWGIFAIFLAAAIAILAWLNLSNDVFDSQTGIDKNKAHSVVNLTGNAKGVLAIANLLLAAGILGIVAIAWWQRDGTVLGIVAACCALGYTYQGPPFRLGYLGLGEPICWLTFGPMAIAAVYYSQTQTWSWTSLPAACLLGLSTSLILFCSHFHQVEDDLAAGKRSPVARMGTAAGARVVAAIISVFFGSLFVFVALGWMPLWTLLAIASLPPAVRLSRLMLRYHSFPRQISEAKFIAVAFHFWTSLLLGLGYWLAVP